MTMMMMMMMMNCFCGKVDQQKASSLISKRNHCQRSHHWRHPTCLNQDLDLHRSWVQALLNEAVQ